MRARKRAYRTRTSSRSASLSCADEPRRVTGSDLSPTLVETAQQQARKLGLDVRLEVADCQALHYADASFDVVSSSVGVIFAPDHARLAAELTRVCKPGGRVGLTAWRRDSGVGDIFAEMAKFMPPPPEGAGRPISSLTTREFRALSS